MQPIAFNVSYKFQENSAKEKWTGTIDYFNKIGESYQIQITSKSSIFVVLTKTSRGWVAAIPDWSAGCYLSTDFEDVFYNTDKLTHAMGNVIDAVTIANALAKLGKYLK